MVFAASSSLRQSGNNSAANLLTESLSSPKRARKIMDTYVHSTNEKIRMSKMNNEEALALVLDCELSKEKVNKLKKNLKNHGSLFVDVLCFFT